MIIHWGANVTLFLESDMEDHVFGSGSVPPETIVRSEMSVEA